MRGFVVTALMLATVGCEAPEKQLRPSLTDWPVRPLTRTPTVVPARVFTATIAESAVHIGPLLPPVVRGPQQIDAFQQDDALVDILWVVDNSASVNDERARLAQQFAGFLRVLIAAGVDFHVGVTSTDLSPITGDQGHLRGPTPFIDNNTPDPRTAFGMAVDFPMSNVSLEEGLRAMELALSPPNTQGPNRGFLREEAALGVIVVSDEDDSSIGPVDHYVRFLRGLKGPGREANISLSGVVGPLANGCIPAGSERIFGADAKAAVRYRAVIDATRGLTESICAPNFAPFVEGLATALSGLRRVFLLSAPPVASTIRVKVDGRLIPENPNTGWTYRPTERAIAFLGSFVPRPRAMIEIRYDVAI
ncbi:MAG: VWA domain-containing protein [Myxococcota bacterium]